MVAGLDGAGAGTGATTGVVTVAGVVVVTVAVAVSVASTGHKIEFVFGTFTDCTLATVDGVSVLCMSGAFETVVVDTSDSDVGDCTIIGASIFTLCLLSVDSETILMAGMSLAIFAFVTACSVDFWAVFGVVGTTITGFGIGIAFFDND